MSDGYRKIFWGLFFVTFNIRLGIITILPAFLGWIIVATGLSNLSKNTSEGNFSKSYTKAMILIFITLFESIFSILGLQLESTILFILLPVLLMTIEFSLFHSLLEASIDNFQALGLGNLEVKYIGKDKVYIVLMGLSLTFLILALAILNDDLILIGTALGLITRMYLLTVISSLSKENYKNHDDMEDYVLE